MVFSKLSKQLQMKFQTDDDVFTKGNKDDLEHSGYAAKEDYGHDEVDGRLKDKILLAIAARSESFGQQLLKAVTNYSKKNFKLTPRGFLNVITGRNQYDSPLHFPLFDLPPTHVIKMDDPRMLEAIRRVLEQVKDEVLSQMNHDDEAVSKMLSDIGNLLGARHPLSKLHHVFDNPSSVTWKPVKQGMDDLKRVANSLDKARWPTLKNKDGAVPKDKLVEVTRERLITLTLMKQLAKLMGDLNKVANSSMDTHNTS